MNYTEHFVVNMRVVVKALCLACFYFAHAIFPHRYTSHEYWGLN